MITLALILAGELTFSGGNVNSLASTLSASTKLPTVVMRGEESLVRSFKIEPSEDRLFRHYLKLHTGLETGMTSRGYGPAAWPKYFVDTSVTWSQTEGIRHGPVDQEPPTIEVDEQGRYNFKLGPSKNFKVSHLQGASVGAQLKVHRIYLRAIVTVGQNTWSPNEFWDALAEAIGAKVLRAGSVIELAFDPSAYRRRMIARIDRALAKAKRGPDPAEARIVIVKGVLTKVMPPTADPYEISDLVFAREVYAAVSNTELTKAVESDNSEFKLRIKPNSRLSRLLLHRLETYANSPNTFGSDAPSRRDLANMVDLDREVFARLDSNGRISMEAWLKGENGKIQL